MLSDLSAALTGGVGTAASISLGPHCAVFEPVHGSAPRHALQAPLRVNPIGAVRAVALLLQHLGRPQAAAVRAAVQEVLADVAHCTTDVGGHATTDACGDALVAATRRLLRH